MRHHVLAFACLVAGCVETPELGETDEAVLSSNKIATNKLQAHELDANKLGLNSLVNAGFQAPELLATQDGRDVLSYIVSCALPANTTLVLQGTGGVKYTFAGGIGLAPMWRMNSPTVSERRWVSACVLARTNLYGIQVALSLRGANPALATPLTEGLGYTLVEGAFYGDLFAPDGPHMYACDALVRDLNLGLSTQDLRACALSDDGATTRCGFTYAGRCSVLDVGLEPACNSLVAPYGACRAGRASKARYDEVITVYLATGL